MIKKNSPLIFFGFVVSIFVLTNCNYASGNNTTDFKQLIQEWNKAHNLKDVGIFSYMFDNSVLFYGKQLEKNACIENKLSLFKKYPDFFQEIYGEIQIEKLNETEIKCSFIKRVTVNQNTTDYPSYLLFKKNGDSWKIAVEGDFITDKNLSKSKLEKKKIPKDAVKGDFNGDGSLEYMWLVEPKTDENYMKCIGDCTSYIKFSDPNIPSIKIENCIYGTPSNEGDLNKNGGDEIGLLPGWFQSCWHNYNVWTLLNGKWVYAVKPFLTFCDQWDAGIKPIEIDYNKEGFVIIRYSEHSDVKITTKSKSVRIVK